MNAIRVTEEILIGWLNVVKKLLKVLQQEEECANVVLWCLSKLRMDHVLPTATFGIAPIHELPTGSSIRMINGHLSPLGRLETNLSPFSPRTPTVVEVAPGADLSITLCR